MNVELNKVVLQSQCPEEGIWEDNRTFKSEMVARTMLTKEQREVPQQAHRLIMRELTKTWVNGRKDIIIRIIAE
jgi:hypothetical protein